MQHKEILQITIGDIVKKVVSSGPSLSDRMESFFLNTDMTPLWVQEIYPKVAQTIHCANKIEQARLMTLLARAADSISDSDLVQQSIRGQQNWGLLPLYSLTSSAAPGYIVGHHSRGAPNPSFPLILGQISKGNKRARLLRELSMHTSGRMSGGASGLRQVRTSSPRIPLKRTVWC